MDRVKSIALLAGFGAALLAASGAGALPPPGHGNRGLESENQPIVQRTDYVMDLAGAYDGLPAAERQRLNGWFRSLDLAYGDRVSIDDPRGADSTRRDIARVAAEYGILLSDGAPITPGEIGPDGVRVIVSRSVAYVPGCPNWAPMGPSSTSPNFGCAFNTNLAAMIADPNDLVLGEQGARTGDATATTKAIKVYRDRIPTSVGEIKAVSSKEDK
ncbi:CpaD family pilus assembly lipoprotein [Sphingosinicella sp. BN140058]|uniref:CpaD family pilus assembly protein n=1 Tax=Sphingosinicella sp. BN140058 TaxID=1892855 RepID=UPI001012C98C|nr:CpaD family pilus assembly lipoprotein [Sphingosinicella sp. BN140058]QAY79579.1 pilus assembly protein CpaD [Sphingosinicella sp. BN140058]